MNVLRILVAAVVAVLLAWFLHRWGIMTADFLTVAFGSAAIAVILTVVKRPAPWGVLVAVAVVCFLAGGLFAPNLLGTLPALVEIALLWLLWVACCGAVGAWVAKIVKDPSHEQG